VPVRHLEGAEFRDAVRRRLSTATALFALKICGALTEETGRLNRGVIFDHWQECGGFSGNIVENHCDCEYTFYGLLAMGAIT
jgi:hypothetical protein